jgi:hypothetical protein
MAPIRSAYKHPTLPRKQTPCAICMLQTEGKTQLVELTHGVSVWLCRWHASEEFRTMRSGRDFELTLFLAWRAQNGYTRNHAKALATHRRAHQGRKRRSEHDLPGSYHWKALRNEAEERFAAGETLASVRRDLLQRHADDVADAPSERTIRRWFHDGRWRRGVRTPVRRGFDRRDARRASRAQRQLPHHRTAPQRPEPARAASRRPATPIAGPPTPNGRPSGPAVQLSSGDSRIPPRAGPR